MTFKGVQAYEAGVEPDSIEITQEELGRSEPDDFISQAARSIVEEWATTTPAGVEFSEKYNSAENRKALSRAMESLGSGLSVASLTKFYSDLKGSGRLRRVYSAEEQEAAAEKRRVSGYRRFFEGSSTSQVKERAKTDREFDQWLKSEIDANTAAPPPEAPPPTREPSRADAHLHRLSQIPERVRQFAERYLKLPSAEAKRLTLTEPGFREAVDEATEFGIL